MTQMALHCRHVDMIDVCLLQVGELLLQSEADPGGAPPLLPQLVTPPAHDAADSMGELLFGPLAAGSNGTPEADRWQVIRQCSTHMADKTLRFSAPSQQVRAASGQVSRYTRAVLASHLVVTSKRLRNFC